MSHREKRLIGGTLMACFLTASLIIARPVVLNAEEECRPPQNYCNPSWGPWHPYYWYFQCHLPPCPVVE